LLCIINYNKWYVTDGWYSWINNKFNVSHSSGRIVAIGNDHDKINFQLKEFYSNYDYSVKNKLISPVFAFAYDPKIPCIY